MSNPPPKRVQGISEKLTDAVYFLWQEFTSGLMRTPSYTVLTVPSAAEHVRRIIYVSNETGGATLAFSDGTNWRRVQDRAVIS
jgi:hypothetical protein